MGVMHKKKPTVILEKGTVEDDNGKKYNLDFVGDDNDFVNISYVDEKKKVDESIKNLFKQNTNEIHDICFINDYSFLLMGCNNGLLYVYKRKINGL
jgi:cobalamin biosynthesis Co2+ chelatase CbiK